MSDLDSQAVTMLLRQARDGDSDARERLFAHVYGELRELAARQLQSERDALTWQPTALVNEAYVRLIDPAALELADRSHFFRLAVSVMRHVLVDEHRRRNAEKRGGDRLRITLVDSDLAKSDDREFDVIDVHEALERLALLDERKSRVVELRFFGGFDLDRVAEILGVSRSTAKADWLMARAWLKSQLDRT